MTAVKGKPSPKDYKATALWHSSTGSFQYYIDSMQRKAAAEGAPLDALYFSNSENKWVCMSDLKEDHSFRKLFAERVK